MYLPVSQNFTFSSNILSGAVAQSARRCTRREKASEHYLGRSDLVWARVSLGDIFPEVAVADDACTSGKDSLKAT
jgi:hypothetical protein